MSLSHLTDIDDDLRARAARVKLACFDVDGTLTDGRLIYDDAGVESKAFHIHDGQGLVLLRRAGLDVALITARHSPAAARRALELGVRIHMGVKDKLAQVDELCAELGLSREQVAFMGDDLPDLAPLRAVGLAVSPADGHAWTARSAHWRTRAPAGAGAARELCDLLLGVQGHVDALLGESA